jgi:hypothetical protein
LATNDDIEKLIVELAQSVAEEAKNAEAFADKIDALKTLTATYQALKKHKTDDPDEDQGTGFDFSKGLTAEEPPNESNVSRLSSRRRPDGRSPGTA